MTAKDAPIAYRKPTLDYWGLRSDWIQREAMRRMSAPGCVCLECEWNVLRDATRRWEFFYGG